MSSVVDTPSDLARTLRAVLLDYGGTLDGDAAHWFDHFLSLYAECGVPLTSDVLRPAFYDADRRIAEELDIRHFGLDRMVRTHVRFQLERLPHVDRGIAEPLADAFMRDTRRAWERNRPLLRRLAERFRLGVISNSYGNMPTLLAEAELGPFELILDSAIVGIAKPATGIYALASERLAIEPAAMLHVGDSWERDVVPAAQVGMRVAWLANPGATQPATTPNVWRLSSLLDLGALLPSP